METPSTITRRGPLAALALALVLALAPAAAAPAQDQAAQYAQQLEQARRALNQERYRQAAELYEQARRLAANRAQAGDALYWEAFARYRTERTAQLEQALALLREQLRDYDDAATAAEAEALAARVAGELAARGQADAARDVYEVASGDRQREETRIAALHALMRMDPDKALPILEKIVTGESGASAELRRNAVFILCQLDERGPDVVAKALPATEDPELLQAMVMCLARTDSPQALDVLTDVMERSDDPDVAAAVLMALGRHDAPRARELLAEIVRDPGRGGELRAHALVGLMQADDERAVGLALGILQEDGQPADLTEVALMALARSDDERARGALLTLAEDPDADEEVRAMALFNAGAHGQVDAARLRRIYESTGSREVKLQICHVLSQMDDQEDALDLMLHIVKNEDDPELRQGAVFWLGQFDDPRAADALLEIIGGE